MFRFALNAYYTDRFITLQSPLSYNTFSIALYTIKLTLWLALYYYCYAICVWPGLVWLEGRTKKPFSLKFHSVLYGGCNKIKIFKKYLLGNRCKTTRLFIYLFNIKIYC